MLADAYQGEIDVVSISTGDHEFGIDGIAIMRNGSMVDSVEEIDEHYNFNKYLKTDIFFFKIKLSGNFDSGDLLKLFNAIDDFFAQQGMTLSQSEDIRVKWDIKEDVYNKAGFLHGLPNLHIFHAKLGQYKNDKNIVSIINSRVSALSGTNLFGSVSFRPLDLKGVQDLYLISKNSSTTTINFPSSIALPAIPRASDAYIGILSYIEYIKIISDAFKTIKLSIFSDSVRDTQPKSDVNKEIDFTLRSDRSMEFPLRNNGINVVCRNLKKVGTSFTLRSSEKIF